jgi:hypothetical protein
MSAFEDSYLEADSLLSAHRWTFRMVASNGRLLLITHEIPKLRVHAATKINECFNPQFSMVLFNANATTVPYSPAKGAQTANVPMGTDSHR